MKEHRKEYRNELLIIGAIISFFLSIVVLTSMIVMLPVAKKGIVFDRFSGKITGELHQGINWINPLTKSISIYDLKITRDDFMDIEGLSSDMQTIKLSLVANWRLDTNNLERIYTTIRGNIKETIMNNAVIDTAKSELGKFRIEEIARNRETLKKAVEDKLRTRLAEKYIDIVNVSIVNVDYSNEYEKSIEQKLIAEQQALEAKNRKEKARYESEAKAIENKNLAQTITPLVLRQKWIEKWDGKLPQYILGGESSVLLGIPEQKN